MKNFTFVKQGTYIKQGEQLRAREAKKMLAGFSSGRNPNAYVKETVADIDENEPTTAAAESKNGDEEAKNDAQVSKVALDVPMKSDEPIPEVEWWDMVFLAKEKQEMLDKNGFLKSRGRSGVIDYSNDMKLKHAGTSHLVEHPARIRVGKKETVVTLPLMLTKSVGRYAIYIKNYPMQNIYIYIYIYIYISVGYNTKCGFCIYMCICVCICQHN
jgi:U4/U6 small nuclear ribonucleoprotein PRP3